MTDGPDVCANCRKPIPAGASRLIVQGTVDWVVGADRPAGGRVIDGTERFCCIRCMGTFVGVTLEKRGLIPPKQP